MEEKRNSEHHEEDARLHSFDEPEPIPPPGPGGKSSGYGTPLASFDEPDPVPPPGPPKSGFPVGDSD